MRFIVMVKASPESEAGVMPSQQLLAEMGKFNEELVKAGVMLEGEGLHPSSKGARIKFSGSKRTVVDGPFAETKEILGGFYLIDVADLDAAIGWAAKIPTATRGRVEVRPIMDVMAQAG